ncbi:unnamed protein product [Brachionus calyciflorus]|uniref:Uncharacterized protein n=1 Tax=Brachionus calyciflorus TaxID=104777 RepID=A0A813PBV9_9BILA|nr:unnamed protein product [Brachionus calyciflorus]
MSFLRQARCYINNNLEKLGLSNLSFDTQQITGFVHRYKNKIVPKNNKVEDVEKYLEDHLYFATMEPNFGFNINDNNKPIIVNGT